MDVEVYKGTNYPNIKCPKNVIRNPLNSPLTKSKNRLCCYVPFCNDKKISVKEKRKRA